ncbi:primosomal protein N' [Sphaerisporangium rubeum]|nr:primosomal protein N' [Sphaerisporangium rubeum]
MPPSGSREPAADEQTALEGVPGPRKGGAGEKALGAVVAAERSPVARVLVDTPLPHLDRPFDYLVPAAMHADAVPGCRVRVRFAGKLTDGFLLERVDSSEHEGSLLALERVVSPEAVLTPEVAALCRAVADRYAGTMSDVVRLAVPPRHGRVEAEPVDKEDAPEETHAGEHATGAGEAATSGEVTGGPGAAAAERPYSVGPVFLAAVEQGRDVRAVWNVLPGVVARTGIRVAGGETAESRRGRGRKAEREVLGAEVPWAVGIAEAVAAAVRGGRGAVVVVPDGKDVALVDTALRGVLGWGRHVALTADLGPAERYRRWLRVLRGRTRVVVGTRAAAFAPVRDLGLLVIWDDGDDLHAERLAPYPHAREVLALRSHQTGAAMLIAGYARTAEATRMIASGWAGPVGPPRDTLRAYAPRVRPAGEDADLARDPAARAARLPTVAWTALRHGLESGPVLIQVPRRGYLPALACLHCRTPSRCTQPPLPVPEPHAPPGSPAPSRRFRAATAGTLTGLTDAVGQEPAEETPPPLCGGPLALRGGHAAPYCRWCGRIAGGWRCRVCGGDRFRALVVGARRTAEELGRAFPAVPVKTSGKDAVLATVEATPALVVATPGAEPVAEGGYAAAVLLDGWALLGRPDLRAAEETLRRWMNAAALLRPASELVVLADSALPPVQALIRWDPVTHSERELTDRTVLGFPPAVRMATLTGTPAAVREMIVSLRLPRETQMLGPVPVETQGHTSGEEERAMLRVPWSAGPALARELKAAAGVRSARKAPDLVRVCMDPMDLI